VGELVETPPVSGQTFDQLVESPLKVSEISGLRPSNFDPSTSLRALATMAPSHNQAPVTKCYAAVMQSHRMPADCK
jgi:hypothetical protein